MMQGKLKRSLAIMAAAIVKICNAPNQVDHLRKVTLANEIQSTKLVTLNKIVPIQHNRLVPMIFSFLDKIPFYMIE